MFRFYFFTLLLAMSFSAIAQDISGVWKTVDDKTGNPKGLIEIKKMPNQSYVGTILKLFPPVGFEAVDICQKCPAPYTNQPMVGMQVLTGLKFNADTDSYSGGKILDPRIGKMYSVKAKLGNNGNRLKVRGYVGISTLGRNQVWIRQN